MMKGLDILANIVKLLGDLAADIDWSMEDWYFAIGELNTILNRWVEELEALKDVSEEPEQLENIIEYINKVKETLAKPNPVIEECVSRLENLVMDIINLSPHLILIDTDFRKEFLSVLRAIPNEYSKAIRDLLLEACRCYENSAYGACIFLASKALEFVLKEALKNVDLSTLSDKDLRDALGKYRDGKATLGDLIRIAGRAFKKEWALTTSQRLFEAIKDIRNLVVHSELQLDEKLTKGFCLLVSRIIRDITLASKKYQ